MVEWKTTIRWPAFGLIVLLPGLACVPIVSRHFFHIQLVKCVLLLMVVVGVLLIFMQPAMPEIWSFQSKLMYIPEQSMDNSPIYGSMTKKPSWPLGLLIATIIVSLAAFAQTIPVQYIVEHRLLYAVGVGITVGIYIYAELFSQIPILYALFIGAMTCASVYVVFTHFPSSSSARVSPWAFALLVAPLPVMYLMEGQLSLINSENREGKKRHWKWSSPRRCCNNSRNYTSVNTTISLCYFW